MLTDTNAKKNKTIARKTLDCFTGRFNSSKTISTIACKPKIRIIVEAMGLGDVNVFMLLVG